MRDFVEDDHLRGVSITKISVQIFTAPSLVRQSHVMGCNFLITGFPQALEIMENLENQEKKFHAWKNHGI